MAKITRYLGNLKAFASNSVGTERTVFGDQATQDDSLNGNIVTDFLRGWGIIGVNAFPKKQDFNALGFTATQLTAYLHQAGIAEWDSDQEYFTGSITNRNGDIYTALTDSVGKAPESFVGVDWVLSNAPDLVSQAEAEAGTSTTIRSWTALRVKQAIQALVQAASETVAGLVERATQAETDALADDSRYVSPLKMGFGFSALLAFNNGYIVFPNWLAGLIIQWTRASVSENSSTDMTLPIAFPTAGLFAIAGDGAVAGQFISVDATTFPTPSTVRINNGSAQSSQAQVFTIGH